MATTTPNYGWDVPTSTDYVKDGATAIETLGDDIDATLYTINNGSNKVGLHLINTTTLTSATNTTISNVFTSAYDNYIIEYRINTGVSTTVELRMASGGTPTSGGTDYAWSRVYWTTTQAALNNGGSNSQAYIAFASVSATVPANGSIHVFSPALASPTGMNGTSSYATLAEAMYGRHGLSTAYDGFNLVSGSAISGVIRVYGLRNS
jgi:hypothetical protein